MTAWSPIARPHGLWIMSSLFGAITTSSAPIAMNDAAEAAMPSTIATTRALCWRSALRIARPSQTMPPGELMCRCTSVVSSGSSSSACTNSFADRPHGPPQSSIGS